MTNPLDRWTGRLHSTRRLVTASTLLIIEVIAAGAAIAAVFSYQSRAGLSEQCTPAVMNVNDIDSLVQATDEVFWSHNPELNRRKIQRHETALSSEWFAYQEQIKACRNEQKRHW